MVTPKRTLCLTLLCSLAFASEGRADDAQAAKDAFVTASRFFHAEEYEAALPLFRKAYTLSGKRPATIFGLAQCERSLKLYDDARKHFVEYLATNPANSDDVKQTISLLDDIIEVRDEAAAKAAKEEAANRAAAEAAAKAAAEREAAEAAAREAAIREQAMREAREAMESERGTPGPEGVEAAAPPPEPKPAPALPPPAPRAAPEPALTATAPAPAEESGSVFESPWFWTITAVVVVGGAVASGVLLTRDNGGDVYGGSSGVVLGR